ncbi:hypothetical protein RvVAR0630_16120 [Agrobacterium vitis]|uniref:DUF1799 domain-containing protein n=1 Tax=Agrobacterium vitis TaxID=373 RepID=UPI0015DCDB42|nr:DUF1799 domain-containing protein [Agrobacterium vitis]BCH58988.1 hypothetical protein RvVAR0630_16120 [Agrobacterium vitis]
MTQEVRNEFAEFGVVVGVNEASGEDIDPVAACNWDSLMAFLACDTQWRVVGVGLGGMIWIGFDYTACDVVFRRGRYADPVWVDLRVMEEAALPVLNSGDE